MTPQSPAGTQTGMEGRQKIKSLELQIAHFFFSNAFKKRFEKFLPSKAFLASLAV
jgi:hypothetical protein